MDEIEIQHDLKRKHLSRERFLSKLVELWQIGEKLQEQCYTCLKISKMAMEADKDCLS